MYSGEREELPNNFVPISEVALETIDGFNPQFPRGVAPGSICANYWCDEYDTQTSVAKGYI